MKNVFKKNQIIISALAIMIAIAGYLNFTKDKSDELSKLDEQFSTVLDDKTDELLNLASDLITDDTKNYEFSDISDEDTVNLSNILAVNDNGDLVLKENAIAKGEETDESMDASKGTDTPGEAVLASTTLNSGFFSSAKLAREQTRSKNKQTLMDVIADATVTDEQKQAAIDCVLQMTATAEMENAAELLLEAKGFEGVVVNIVEGNVDVVVNSEYITDAQIAQIEDIVIRKTNASPDNIVITSVVVEE